MNLKIVLALSLITSNAIADETKKPACDAGLFQAVKNTILCRGSLSFTSCVGGVAGGIAGATKLVQTATSNLTGAEAKRVTQLEQELKPLHEKHLKASQFAQDTVNKTRQKTTNEIERDTQNRVLGSAINSLYEGQMGGENERLYKTKMAELRGLTGENEVQIAKRLEISQAKVIAGKVAKYLIPGVGAAAFAYDVIDNAFTAIPIACQQIDEKYMSLDNECKNNFETISENSRNFLMMSSIEQEKILHSNPRLCEHYQKMLDYMNKFDGYQINSLKCSQVKNGMEENNVEVTVSKANPDGSIKKLTQTVHLDGSRQPEVIETYDSETKEGSRIFFKQKRGAFTSQSEPVEKITEMTDIQYQIPVETRGTVNTALTPVTEKPQTSALAKRHARAIKQWYSSKSYLSQLISCCMDSKFNERNQRVRYSENECVEKVSGKINREQAKSASGAANLKKTSY